MKIQILQSVPYEGPGSIATWAEFSGAKIHVTRIDLLEPLPETSDFDALVVLGGATDLTRKDNPAWVADVENLVKKSLQSKKKVLAICLGAQIVAKALGAKVTKNNYLEIGWHGIRSVTGKVTRALHWHENTFSIPKGAKKISSSDACENQGFTYGSQVLALQYHPEWNQEIISAVIEAEGMPLIEEKVESGNRVRNQTLGEKYKFVQNEFEILNGDFDSLKLHCFDLLNDFFGEFNAVV